MEKTLDSALDKGMKPVHPKENQPWIFTGRTDAEAQAPIPWPPDAKSRLTGKDPNAGKDWRQEEKGVTEDEMVGWHHQLNGHEFEQTLEDSEGQGSQACCSSWGRKESDTTEWLNTTTTTYIQHSSPLTDICSMKAKPGSKASLRDPMWGFPGGPVGWESICQCRQGFNPWPRKIPRATEQLSLCPTTSESML